MHSLIAPSKAKFWVPCPGSALMQAHFQSIVTEYAKKGLCTHSLSADLLYKPGPREKYVGKYTLHDVVVTDEIFDMAQMYAEEVRAIAGDGAHIEETVSAPNIHLESYGTCDAWFYDAINKILYIWDLKTGFASVSAFENWQLLNYAAGILSNPNDPASNATSVVLTIIQPNDFGPEGPIKSWTIFERGELDRYFDVLRVSANDAFSEKPTIRSGKHCQNCQARHACEAKRLSAFDAFEYSCEPTPTHLTPEQLGEELTVLSLARDHIEHRITALETEVESLINKGAQIPQWELRSASKKQIWTLDANDLEQIDPNLVSKKPITPKQALKKGIDETIVNTFSKTIEGRKKLMPYGQRSMARRFKNAENKIR